MRKFKLNGTEYEFEGINFNSVCKLEDLGGGITAANEKPMSFMRAFIALAVGDVEKAGNELEAHLIKGGSLEEISNLISDEVAESDFFQSMQGDKTKLKPVK
ncbi:MAG: hypothetical protein RSD63_08240 [Eubacterium sp.]